MIKSCVFHTPISPSYFRNNRSTRQKSLRCFPMCSTRGHVNGGFCGQSIRTTLTLSPQNSTTEKETTQTIETAENLHENTINDNKHSTEAIDINDFIIIMEIRPLLTPRISKEKYVKKQDILTQLRTKHEKSSLEKELFMGEIEVLNLLTGNEDSNPQELALSVTFNSNHSSWDYSWKSNRWLGPNEFHVADIIVLKYHSPTEFEVASNSTSDPFVVVSSHKKSTPATTISSFDPPTLVVSTDGMKEESQSELLPTTAVAMSEIAKKDGTTSIPATKKRNTGQTHKQPARHSRSRDEEADDMDVLEGAQLLGALSGNLVPVPAGNSNSTSVEEENLPVDTTSTHYLPSAPKPALSTTSTLSSSALAVVLPVSSTSAQLSNPVTTSHSKESTTATITPVATSTAATATAKKVAISHDKHLRLYEVHYPNVSLIEEVRNNALQLPKHSNGIQHNTTAENSSSSSSKRVAKSRASISNPMNASSERQGPAGKRQSSLPATSNRNHRQLPDKDPNPSTNSSGEELALPSDAIRAGAHQLLLLSSKEQKLEAQAIVEGFYGETASTTSALSSNSPTSASHLSSRNKRKRRATYPTTIDALDHEEDYYAPPQEESMFPSSSYHRVENTNSLFTLAASASQVANQEMSLPFNANKKIRLPSSLRMSTPLSTDSSHSSTINNNNNNSHFVSIPVNVTTNSGTKSNNAMSTTQAYYNVFQLPGKPVETMEVEEEL